MSSFTRNITENLSMVDFLNADSNRGLGPHLFFPIFLQDSFGPAQMQPIFLQDSFGDATSAPHQVNRFPVQGDATPLIAQLFSPKGAEQGILGQIYAPTGGIFDSFWGLDRPRNLTENLAFASDVDWGGNFTRHILENLTLIGRVGQSKALFFRQDFSSVVTSNPSIRQLLPVQDSGEIAASERPTIGALRVMRYDPGTTPGSPNLADLGVIPTTVGSQGFIFDNSPTGIFLRGAWEVNLVIADTTATGTYTVSVNLFVVTADSTSVHKVKQVGTTKTSSPVTPSASPAQVTFDWPANEVGEVFIDSDQYIYIETFMTELSHPGVVSYAKLRLNDLSNTVFSDFQYPGVSAETTYNLAPADETLAISDSVARIKGFNRDLTETLTMLDTLARKLGFQRNLSEALAISDSVTATVYTIFETLSFSDSVVLSGSYLRGLAETLAFSDSVVAHNPTQHQSLVESLVISDLVGFSISRVPVKAGAGGVDKRRLDSLKRLSMRRRG